MNKRSEYLFKNYITLAFAAAAGFLAEPIVKIIESLIYGTPYAQFNFSKEAVHLVIMAAILIIWTYFIYAFAKEKYDLHFFISEEMPAKNNIVASLYFLLVVITISSGLWNWSLKPIALFFQYYDNYIFAEGMGLYGLLYLKYTVEAVLIFQVLNLGQMALEEKTDKFKPFLGGFFLAVTWGILQFIMRWAFSGALYMAIAMIYGIVLQCIKDNKKIAFALILFMFWF